MHLPIAGFILLNISCAKLGSFRATSGVSNPNSGQSSSLQPPVNEPAAGLPVDTGGGSLDLPSTGAPSYKLEALAWESSSHPERTEWSLGLQQFVAKQFLSLDKAQDISLFCPRYSSLSQDQKINLWAELFAVTAYYESGYDPFQSSVDVGSQSDRNTWSVGLLQLSVVDQQSYNLPFGYSFENLQEPLKNLNLGVAIMAAQIKKYSRILIPVGSPGLYWATLHPGGKYDATSSIQAKTKQLSFCRL